MPVSQQSMSELSNLKILSQEMHDELIRILDYWCNNTRDREFGGFVGQIKANGSVVVNATKGAVLNARLLWTFSTGFRYTNKSVYLEMADRSFNYLIENFWDDNNGGLYWELDYTGKLVNSRKQAYAQGFGIYAFSEYFLATGSNKGLEYAKKLFRILEDKFKDKTLGGYIEALSADWQPMEDMRLSPKDVNSPKSMNTHLHILEPYTNLYRAWPESEVKDCILDLVQIFQERIIDSKTGHLNLFFDYDWTIQSTIISYGHDIEAAWLLHEAAIETKEDHVVGDVQKKALRLVELTLNEGRGSDGSIYYEKEGEDVDKDRHWWVQAEAMVGLMDAWEIEPDTCYLEGLYNIWSYIKSNLIDTENGEWYWSTDEFGNHNPDHDKAGFWKCPYHNSRALIEIICRVTNHLT